MAMLKILALFAALLVIATATRPQAYDTEMVRFLYRLNVRMHTKVLQEQRTEEETAVEEDDLYDIVHGTAHAYVHVYIYPQRI